MSLHRKKKDLTRNLNTKREFGRETETKTKTKIFSRMKHVEENSAGKQSMRILKR